MIAALAAAMALVSAASLDSPAASAATAVPAADPLGALIQQSTGAAADEHPAGETSVKATLYHASIKGMRARDSLGCKLQPMRTVSVDPAVFPRRSVLFIKETVGMRLPDGTLHDGFWYASDVGAAIKGQRVDLFTGATAESMKAFQPLKLNSLTVVKVGTFAGCPSAGSPAPSSRQVADAN